MSALARVQRDMMALLRAPAEPAAPGLAVYHRALRAGRRAALAGAYPVVRRLVGADFFAAMADAFAESHPSRSGDLHRFGDAFPAFVATYAPAGAVAALGDVARVEWALHESFHAADAPAFDFARLAEVPAERQAELRPRLHPAARLLACEHDAVEIWEANQPDRDGATGDVRGATRVLVAREGLAPVPRRVTPAEWRVLECAARGETLAQACAALEAQAASLGAILARFAATGAICAFDGLA